MQPILVLLVHLRRYLLFMLWVHFLLPIIIVGMAEYSLALPFLILIEPLFMMVNLVLIILMKPS